MNIFMQFSPRPKSRHFRFSTSIDKAFRSGKKQKGSRICHPKISTVNTTQLCSESLFHFLYFSEEGRRFIFVISFFYGSNFSPFFYQTSINMCLFEVDKQCSRNMTLGKVMQILSSPLRSIKCDIFARRRFCSMLSCHVLRKKIFCRWGEFE